MHNPPVPLSRFQKRLAVAAVVLTIIDVAGVLLMTATVRKWFDLEPMPAWWLQIFCNYLFVVADLVGGLSTYHLAFHSGRTRRYSVLLGILVVIIYPFVLLVIPGLALEIRKRSQGLQTGGLDRSARASRETLRRFSLSALQLEMVGSRGSPTMQLSRPHPESPQGLSFQAV